MKAAELAARLVEAVGRPTVAARVAAVFQALNAARLLKTMRYADAVGAAIADALTERERPDG